MIPNPAQNSVLRQRAYDTLILSPELAVTTRVPCCSGPGPDSSLLSRSARQFPVVDVWRSGPEAPPDCTRPAPFDILTCLKDPFRALASAPPAEICPVFNSARCLASFVRTSAARAVAETAGVSACGAGGGTLSAEIVAMKAANAEHAEPSTAMFRARITPDLQLVLRRATEGKVAPMH